MLTSPAKPPSGTTHSGIQGFKLTYESLEGYGNILGRKLEVNPISLQTKLLMATVEGTATRRSHSLVLGKLWLL